LHGRLRPTAAVTSADVEVPRGLAAQVALGGEVLVFASGDLSLRSTTDGWGPPDDYGQGANMLRTTLDGHLPVAGEILAEAAQELVGAGHGGVGARPTPGATSTAIHSCRDFLTAAITALPRWHRSSWIFEPCMTWATALQRVQRLAFSCGN
jgi:hypothetical protein